MGRALLRLAPVLAALLFAPAASAGDWLPHPKGATWTYSWTDSEYNPTPTKEKVTVAEQKREAFTLAWTTEGLDNPADAADSAGTVSFQETGSGLVNTNWTSSPPPIAFPILCVQASSCGNSLASVYYNVIWGARQPTLAEPLIRHVVVEQRRLSGERARRDAEVPGPQPEGRAGAGEDLQPRHLQDRCRDREGRDDQTSRRGALLRAHGARGLTTPSWEGAAARTPRSPAT